MTGANRAPARLDPVREETELHVPILSRVASCAARGPRAGLARLALAFAALCLLNAPFWWISRDNYLSRALFDLDLLLPLWIARRRPVVAGLVLLLLWTLELAVSESLAWHFHSPLEFIRSIEFLAPGQAAGLFARSRWLGLAVPFSVAGAAAIALSRRGRVGGRAVLGVALALAVVDVMNGSSSAWNPAVRMLPANVAGTALKSTLQSVLASRSEDALRPLPHAAPFASAIEGASASGYFDIAGWVRQHRFGSVLLVLVESMGVHHDARMRDWLKNELVDPELAARYDLKQIDVLFNGGTTDGELRELCGLKGSYRAMTSQIGALCLPAQLDAMGWKTLGLHGFSRRMFLREKWWLQVGLQQPDFAEDMKDRSGILECGGAFPGICDETMVKAAVEFVRQPAHFAYLVTLNSHLPIDGGVAFAGPPAPCAAAGTGPEICAHAAVLSHALEAVRRALIASPVAPLVVLVGDHAPPFAATAARNQFDHRTVPAFALVPRQ